MKLWRVAVMVLLVGGNALAGNFDGKVELGMSYKQVVQFLEKEGKKVQDYMMPYVRIEVYCWERTVMTFHGDKLLIISEESYVPKSEVKKTPLDNFENPDLHPADYSREISLEKFDAVKIDMTYEQVVKILGTTSIYVKRYTDDTAEKYKEVSIFQWFNEYSPASVNVIFVDGEVIGKGQVGLIPVGSDPADPVGSLKVGMKSEEVVSLLGTNSICRKYLEAWGSRVLNLCRWRTRISIKINVIFLEDRLIGIWKY